MIGQLSVDRNEAFSHSAALTIKREMLQQQYYWMICRVSLSKTVYFQTFVTRFNCQPESWRKMCPQATDRHADSCQLACLKAWLLCESQCGVLFVCKRLDSLDKDSFLINWQTNVKFVLFTVCLCVWRTWETLCGKNNLKSSFEAFPLPIYQQLHWGVAQQAGNE